MQQSQGYSNSQQNIQSRRKYKQKYRRYYFHNGIDNPIDKIFMKYFLLFTLKCYESEVGWNAAASDGDYQVGGIGYESYNQQEDDYCQYQGAGFYFQFFFNKCKIRIRVYFLQLQQFGDLIYYVCHFIIIIIKQCIYLWKSIKNCFRLKANIYELYRDECVCYLCFLKQQQNNMIGSLGQFLELETDNILESVRDTDRGEKQLSPLKVPRRRGKSTFETYAPQDKTDLLIRYQKNNVFNINRKKYNSIAQQAQSKDRLRRPLYEHRSFFVKPQVARDYIAKEQLKRKHNLLRAILRMKQTEQQPKGQSDYQQSFQRLYSGFKAIHPQPILHKNKESQVEKEQQIAVQKMLAAPIPRTTSNLGHKKRLQYEHCLRWAKKHNKNGDFFAVQLGKYDNSQNQETPVLNRSLIDDISKKLELNWLQ